MTPLDHYNRETLADMLSDALKQNATLRNALHTLAQGRMAFETTDAFNNRVRALALAALMGGAVTDP